MKPTEQMLDQGELALEKYGAVDSPMSLEILLDCVLADVPDPYEATSALVNADRRIAALEAKLAEVRAMAAEYAEYENDEYGSAMADVLKILDGKKSP